MKVVLDTNVFLSGVIWGGKPAKIIEKWAEGKFELLISEDTFSELLKKANQKIQEYNLDPKLFIEIYANLKSFARWVEPKEKVIVCRDPKDNMFLELSLAGKADFLISGDEDLLVLKKFKKTKIVSPAKFLASLK